MLSLSSLGALVLPRRPRRKVVTGYSGDVFPNFTPNPWFAYAYLSGEVEVEHWSFLTFLQRLEAAARGLPAVTTASLAGSSMADNPGYAAVATPFGEVGLLEAYAPDVALLHAPVADRHGNLAFNAPDLEGVWGALAARRGVVATVDRVVDDIRPWSHLVHVPGHRVLAVAETPMGAHPGGLFARDTPGRALRRGPRVLGRGAGGQPRRRTSTTGSATGSSNRPTRTGTSTGSAQTRIARLRRRAAPDSWRDDEARPPAGPRRPGGGRGSSPPCYGARYLAGRVTAAGADAVLAGAGVANLAAWLAVRLARDAGSDVVLTAELGLWGYEPTPADPFVFNHRSFPTATMLGDADQVLGALVSGPGTTLLACLGAAQIDRHGNINSTVIPDKVVPRRVRRRQRRGLGRRRGGGDDDPDPPAGWSPRSPTSPRWAAGCGPSSPTWHCSRRTPTGVLAPHRRRPRCRHLDMRVDAVRALCPWDLSVGPTAGRVGRARPGAESNGSGDGTRRAASSAPAA